MRKSILSAVVASLMFVSFVGCEWEAPQDGETWNSSYSWVNFIGVYRNPGGGALVVDYKSTPPTDPSIKTVKNEGHPDPGVGDTTYPAGLLDNAPIVSGSVVINAGPNSFGDNGDGTLTGTGDSVGKINYLTGSFSLDNGTEGLLGSPVKASYQYTVAGKEGQTIAGSSGTTIYTMYLDQMGNVLTFTDSDGMSYTGRMGTVTSTTGKDARETAGQVIADFTANGVSKIGLNVTIMGTLTAVYMQRPGDAASSGSSGGATGGSGGQPTLYLLTQRTLTAQWIERNAGGTIVKTGEMVGTTTEIPVTIDWEATSNFKS